MFPLVKFSGLKLFSKGLDQFPQQLGWITFSVKGRGSDFWTTRESVLLFLLKKFLVSR